MDIYDLTQKYLLGSALIDAWQEMKDLITKSCSGRPRDWGLPVLACRAVGGSTEQAIPAAASIACMQTSIILVDDLLDSDPRGVHHRLGVPATANLACAFQLAGLDAIHRCEVNDATKLAALRNLTQMSLTTALGQLMDVNGPENEEEYWRIVRTKSSPFFGSGLFAGALFGGCGIDVAIQFERLGHLYGEMIQIHDDLNDTMAVPANPDWTLNRSPLPILYARLVNHADRTRFLSLRQDITDPAALKEAQTILIRCGAVSYCIHQLLNRHTAARKLLDAMPVSHREELSGLLDGVVEPVEKLFAEIGIPDFRIK